MLIVMQLTTHTSLDGGIVDGATILARAREAGSILRQEADESERRRRLTERAVAALRDAGAFRLPMPHSWGGPEADIVTQTAVLEELSAADGSAGWCAMVGSEGGYFAAVLGDDTGRSLFPHLDTAIAGVAAPTGKLHRSGRRDQGGYRLDGTWRFGSGCTHAEVVYVGAVVHEHGEPSVVDGRPEVRYALVPARDIEVLDTWHTTGLAGTGSHDFTITGVTVPAEHTLRLGDLRRRPRPGTLYSWPGLLGAKVPGVPLGIARAALGAAESLLGDQAESARARADYARAQAMVGSARSYVYDLLGGLWATLEAGDEPSFRQRAALGGMQVHTIRTCLDAVRVLLDLVGSASIYRRCPLERHHRDLVTMSQHGLGQARRLELVGALWLGVDRVIDEHPVTREGFL
jgi:alkylation response protein AidB-like acyl-CoA dehydrogenase